MVRLFELAPVLLIAAAKLRAAAPSSDGDSGSNHDSVALGAAAVVFKVAAVAAFAMLADSLVAACVFARGSRGRGRPSAGDLSFRAGRDTGVIHSLIVVPLLVFVLARGALGAHLQMPAVAAAAVTLVFGCLATAGALVPPPTIRPSGGISPHDGGDGVRAALMRLVSSGCAAKTQHAHPDETRRSSALGRRVVCGASTALKSRAGSYSKPGSETKGGARCALASTLPMAMPIVACALAVAAAAFFVLPMCSSLCGVWWSGFRGALLATPALVFLVSHVAVHLGPRSFSILEASLLAVGVGLLALANPKWTPMSTPLAISWILAVASVLLALAAATVTALKFKLEHHRHWAMYALPMVLAGGPITVLTAATLGLNPWTWALWFFFSKSTANVLIVSYWGAMCVLCALFWPNDLPNSNMRRKYFHFFATITVAPIYVIAPDLCIVAFGLLLYIFVAVEIWRVAGVPPVGPFIDRLLVAFRDKSEQGTLLTSHFSLLLGLMVPAIMGRFLGRPALGACGFAAVGVGDTLASVIGERYGDTRWVSTSAKTIAGTIAFVVSCFVHLSFQTGTLLPPSLTFLAASVGCAFVEASTRQTDNYILPLSLMLAIA